MPVTIDPVADPYFQGLADLVRSAVSDVVEKALKDADGPRQRRAISTGLTAAAADCYLSCRPDDFTEEDCVQGFLGAGLSYLSMFFGGAKSNFPKRPS